MILIPEPTPTSLPPMVQGYLLGFISVSCFWTGLFFLKFWKQTRDSLFLCFAISFFIEGLNRASILMLEKPNEGKPYIYLVRMVAALIILGAILAKNRGSRERPRV